MIDEKKLIERLWERHRDVQSNYDYSNEEAEIICNNICNIVSIIDVQQQVDKWIPCDERLPENLEQVLVWYEYFRFGDYNCMYQTYGIGYHLDGFWSGDVSGHKARCIAWQPLPQPYKKEGAENEK